HGKSRAEENAAAVRKVLEQAILDAVARAAVNSSTISQKWDLPGAMSENIEARRVSLRPARRPDGKTIVACPARGAVRDDRAAYAAIQIDPVRQGVAKPAAIHDEPA